MDLSKLLQNIWSLFNKSKLRHCSGFPKKQNCHLVKLTASLLAVISSSCIFSSLICVINANAAHFLPQEEKTDAHTRTSFNPTHTQSDNVCVCYLICAWTCTDKAVCRTQIVAPKRTSWCRIAARDRPPFCRGEVRWPPVIGGGGFLISGSDLSAGRFLYKYYEDRGYLRAICP